MARILCFSGSTSSTSINQALVSYAATLLPDHDTHIIDLRDYLAPIYSIDLEKEKGIPPMIQRLIEHFQQYDAFLISTPEHNGLMTAHMKNTLDWLSRAEKGVMGYKPVFLMSTSPGKRGAKSSLEHTARILGYLGAKVNGTYSLGSFYDNVDRENGFYMTDECEQKKLEELLRNWERDSGLV